MKGDLAKQDLVRSGSPDFFKPLEREAFERGFAAGQLAAETPSGEAFEAAFETAAWPDKVDLVADAAWALVQEGKLENAIAGLHQTGLLESSEVLASDKAYLAALVGDLQWLENGIRSGAIEGYEIQDMIDPFKWFMTAAREHGFDLSAQPEQVADLITSTEDEYALSTITDEIALSDRDGYAGGGEILFKAAEHLDGEPKSWAIWVAHKAAIDGQ
ncbi:hypothetical protein [Poseidonocella sedimentorum]|uniref:Uncharacterized protein n=1 Tax=Poseidonocella sedimentorum TaxID=871652 RepID=A0A1I6E629_9RHOB|nr:hypothetical protein [Poseidonocella sedimentorum]SFR12958.1 hypothetical protein SAMN04515673_107144 [Poseidonocella sedimentorum]